ncbi:MAG: hypothetical protein COB49_10490 [Alphaproteobacteria bacterium]|nr:MAG: hypothetical protein COB49_10490 [Alphaproteobacteria bacterium]
MGAGNAFKIPSVRTGAGMGEGCFAGAYSVIPWAASWPGRRGQAVRENAGNSRVRGWNRVEKPKLSGGIMSGESRQKRALVLDLLRELQGFWGVGGSALLGTLEAGSKALRWHFWVWLRLNTALKLWRWFGFYTP